jgi:hypothetical protein
MRASDASVSQRVPTCKYIYPEGKLQPKSVGMTQSKAKRPNALLPFICIVYPLDTVSLFLLDLTWKKKEKMSNSKGFGMFFAFDLDVFAFDLPSICLRSPHGQPNQPLYAQDRVRLDGQLRP